MYISHNIHYTEYVPNEYSELQTAARRTALSPIKILNWKNIYVIFFFWRHSQANVASFSRAVSKRLVIYRVGSSRDNTSWRLLWMSEPNELSAHLADRPTGRPAAGKVLIWYALHYFRTR